MSIIKLNDVVSLCSGFGQILFALKNANVDIDTFYYSEVNKYANKFLIQNIDNYQNINEIGDIFGIDISKYNYLQDDIQLLSVLIPRSFYKNNKMQDFLLKVSTWIKLNPDNIIFETIPEILTKYKNILGQIKELAFGYNILVTKYISKDYGLPQNRERVHIILTKREFKYPDKYFSDLSMCDLFEEKTNKKYSVNKTTLNRLSKKSVLGELKPYVTTEFSKMEIVNWDETFNKDKLSYAIFDFGKGKRSAYYQLYNPQSIAPTLDADNIIKVIDYDFTDSKVKSIILATLPPKHKLFNILEKTNVRRLTPREYFNLQGFSIFDFDFNGISDTQLYNMVEGSQDANILSKIFKKIFCE